MTIFHNRNKLSQDVKSEVIRDHSGVCFYCGQVGNYVDHIEPICRGGSNERSNLTCSCYDCNKVKGKWALRPAALTVTLNGSSGRSGNVRFSNLPADEWLDRSAMFTKPTSVEVGEDMTEYLEEWVHQNRIKSVGAAVRCMIRFALANGVKPDDEPDLRRKVG